MRGTLPLFGHHLMFILRAMSQPLRFAGIASLVAVTALLQACGSDESLVGTLVPSGSVAVTSAAPLLVVAAGSNSVASLTIARTNFNGPVTLKAEDLPAGMTAAFAPQSVTGNSSTLTLNAASNTAPGSYNVHVRASATGLTDAATTVPITVTASPGFAISSGTEAITVANGTTSTTFLKAARTTGFAGAITYIITGAPVGLTATGTPTGTADSTVLYFTASATLGAGSYPLVVTASAPAALDQHVNITVAVNSSVGGIHAFKTVVAGNASTCALSATGVAYCWGLNNNGQLGNGATSNVNTHPLAVAGGFTFEDITISGTGRFACGIRSGGAAYCWGNNDVGQLGDGTTTQRLSPKAVAGNLRFQLISAGEHHACGLTHEFAIYCWGLNTYGALGDGTAAMHLTPAPVSGSMTFRAVSAGNDYTCAITQAGAAYCWGLGNFGQLGNGTTGNSLTPSAVAGGLLFNAIAAGGLDVCGLTPTGAAYCWGHNFYGEVGDGTTILRNTPAAVSGGRAYVSISAGFEHFCANAAGGIGYCWGYNETAALGDGSFTNRSVPSPVLEQIRGPLLFQSMGSGYAHGCGITQMVGSSNEIYCWGLNGSGELGLGTVAPTAGPFEVEWL